MTIVSSKEFVCHDDKYFDLAIKEQVFIRRDNIMFIVKKADENQYKRPDEDFRRAITAEELKKRMHIVIDNFFNQEDERNIHTGGC